MQLKVAAVGQRMPGWVGAAWHEYARRFPRSPRLELIEIPTPRRGKNADIERIKAGEGAGLMAATAGDVLRVALEMKGNRWSTRALAENLEQWMAGGRDVAFIIGGPDGLSGDCLASADCKWSLGPLTLPHPLCRVIVAEQLYRAWSIVNNHPYHRV